jgi:hypothetical protein
MSSPDWLPLREHLEADFTRQVDAIISGEADPEARAILKRHRGRLIEQLVDKEELRILRAHLAQRDAQDEAAGATMQ